MSKCNINLQSLNNARTNQVYKINGFQSGLDFAYKRRLLELGFFYGEKIQVLKKSFYKKTFLVLVRGDVFCLRKDLAEYIKVAKQ